MSLTSRRQQVHNRHQTTRRDLIDTAKWFYLEKPHPKHWTSLLSSVDTLRFLSTEIWHVACIIYSLDERKWWRCLRKGCTGIRAVWCQGVSHGAGWAWVTGRHRCWRVSTMGGDLLGIRLRFLGATELCIRIRLACCGGSTRFSSNIECPQAFCGRGVLRDRGVLHFPWFYFLGVFLLLKKTGKNRKIRKKRKRKK